jgi:hypothetical protein
MSTEKPKLYALFICTLLLLSQVWIYLIVRAYPTHMVISDVSSDISFWFSFIPARILYGCGGNMITSFLSFGKLSTALLMWSYVRIAFGPVSTIWRVSRFCAKHVMAASVQDPAYTQFLITSPCIQHDAPSVRNRHASCSSDARDSVIHTKHHREDTVRMYTTSACPSKPRKACVTSVECDATPGVCIWCIFSLVSLMSSISLYLSIYMIS